MQDGKLADGTQQPEPATETTYLPLEVVSDPPHVVFDEETFQEPAPPAEITTGKDSATPPAETGKEKAPRKTAGNKKDNPPAAPKPKSRETKTLSFTPAEFEYIDKIFQARKESGLNDDYNQFLRQCVDFAVNHDAVRHLYSKVSFARPGVPHLFLKDAFYQKSK